MLHGTGSNLAKMKVVLEKQWLEYMDIKIERDKISDEKHATILDQKKEMIKLKKKHLMLKEQEIEQKNEYSRKKLEKKENKHAEIIQIEKEKCKLLNKLVKAQIPNNLRIYRYRYLSISIRSQIFVQSFLLFY